MNMDQPARDDGRIPDAPGTRGARVVLWIAWAIAGYPFIIMAFRGDCDLYGALLVSLFTLPVAAVVAILSLAVGPSRGAALLIGLAMFGWALIFGWLPVVIERVMH